MTPNFYTPCQRATGHGLCQAFDRAEAATCAFYEKGRDGYCRHTVRERRVGKKVIEHVTGECWSEGAERGYIKGKAR